MEWDTEPLYRPVLSAYLSGVQIDGDMTVVAMTGLGTINKLKRAIAFFGI